jgi:hypothetical protein
MQVPERLNWGASIHKSFPLYCPFPDLSELCQRDPVRKLHNHVDVRATRMSTLVAVMDGDDTA